MMPVIIGRETNADDGTHAISGNEQGMSPRKIEIFFLWSVGKGLIGCVDSTHRISWADYNSESCRPTFSLDRIVIAANVNTMLQAKKIHADGVRIVGSRQGQGNRKKAKFSPKYTHVISTNALRTKRLAFSARESCCRDAGNQNTTAAPVRTNNGATTKINQPTPTGTKSFANLTP